MGKEYVELDCDCACSLAGLATSQNHQTLTNDAYLQTCQPIYTHALAPDFDLILSPDSHSTLAVINGPARRLLDFFDHGGTLQTLIETIIIPEAVCREAVMTLWEVGFLVSASDSKL